ncbi:hypothetical protein B2_17 [Stenotrophomonas phage B2]|nr:hypothetical protein B2_17 [Stenotrophomonas phage B2]
MINLRPFQQDIRNGIEHALAELAFDSSRASPPNVLAVAPTGAGKTVIMTDAIEKVDAPQVAIAHREELVGQISEALCSRGIYHGIIGSDATVRNIRKANLETFGINFINQQSHIRVAGVDTLVRINPETDRWFKSVRRRHDDEAHHVLPTNKWGRGVEMFPNAWGIGYTATPMRADGKALGSQWGGIYDRLIEGPKMRDLINMGYLTDYRLICPPVEDLNLDEVQTSGTTGDYVYEQVRKAVNKSQKIVGNAVDTYLQYAPGKLGVTFAVDIEAATKIAAEFRAKGVTAEVITGKTPADLRRSLLRRFARREIMMLVNVDLFGEGFDLPAIEVVIMARPTKSFSLYAQQFGRGLRLMISKVLAAAWGSYTDEQRLAHIAASEKPWAIIIDLVENWKVHRLPDHVGRVFSLEPRASHSRRVVEDDLVPLRRCPNPNPVPPFGVLCQTPYERHLNACPNCGHSPEPAERSGPEQVDGDVFEMSPEALALLRGEVAKAEERPKFPMNASYQVKAGITNRHEEKVKELAELKRAMMLWGAGQAALSPDGLDDNEQMKLFYLTFGIDVLSAQALSRADAATLRERIERRLAIDNIVRAD